jgi:hypothetical protein
MEGNEVSRVGRLALVWLLTRPEGKGSRSGLSSALKSFSSHRWSSSEWSTRLDESLAALESKGLVRQTARKGLLLTKEGRAQGLTFLGMERLPKGLDWKKLRLTHLTAHALQLPASSAGRLGKADDLRAVLVQKQLGLAGVGTRTLKQVRDELCWKQLGVETDKPFTLAAVQSFLLGQVLQASREVKPSQAMQQLAARSVGARRMDAESLRVAALQSWLIPSAEPARSSGLPRASEPTAQASRPAEEGLHAFAERVLHIARGSASGRFGNDRVFISHVWRAMRGQGLDEHSFKNRLVEANQKRLLSLSRADMVELMDPADVAASEIHHLGSTFHFIAL